MMVAWQIGDLMIYPKKFQYYYTREFFKIYQKMRMRRPFIKVSIILEILPDFSSPIHKGYFLETSKININKLFDFWF